MKFVQSCLLAVIAAASVSATIDVVPACMKPCSVALQKASGCAASDIMCLCSAEQGLIAKVAACGVSACTDDKTFGTGLRAVVAICETAATHREILRRNAPELFRREIDEESCKKCADSKHFTPPVLTPVPQGPSPNMTYPNITTPGLTPGKPNRTRHLPKAPTGAATSVQTTTAGVLGAVALAVMML